MIASLNDHYTSKGGEQMVAAISNNSLVRFILFFIYGATYFMNIKWLGSKYFMNISFIL